MATKTQTDLTAEGNDLSLTADTEDRALKALEDAKRNLLSKRDAVSEAEKKRDEAVKASNDALEEVSKARAAAKKAVEDHFEAVMASI